MRGRPAACAAGEEARAAPARWPGSIRRAGGAPRSRRGSGAPAAAATAAADARGWLSSKPDSAACHVEAVPAGGMPQHLSELGEIAWEISRWLNVKKGHAF